MSWIRLLNTSRSFTAENGEPRGYRLTQMNLIPKFGNTGGIPSMADPSALASPARSVSAAAAATRKITPVVALPRAMVVAAPAPEPVVGSTLSVRWFRDTIHRARLGEALPKLVSSARGGSSWLVGVLGGATGATVEIFGRLVRRWGAQSSIAPVRPAQAELKLEAIQPVHNDLSDCDYEVRPRHHAAPVSAPAAPLAETEAELPPARDTGVFALAGDAAERVRTLIH